MTLAFIVLPSYISTMKFDTPSNILRKTFSMLGGVKVILSVNCGHGIYDEISANMWLAKDGTRRCLFRGTQLVLMDDDKVVGHRKVHSWKVFDE